MPGTNTAGGHATVSPHADSLPDVHQPHVQARMHCLQGQSRAKATSHDKKANSTAALSSAALGVRGGVNSGGAQSLKQLAHRFLDGRVIQVGTSFIVCIVPFEHVQDLPQSAKGHTHSNDVCMRVCGLLASACLHAGAWWCA